MTLKYGSANSFFMAAFFTSGRRRAPRSAEVGCRRQRLRLFQRRRPHRRGGGDLQARIAPCVSPDRPARDRRGQLRSAARPRRLAAGRRGAARAASCRTWALRRDQREKKVWSGSSIAAPAASARLSRSCGWEGGGRCCAAVGLEVHVREDAQPLAQRCRPAARCPRAPRQPSSGHPRCRTRSPPGRRQRRVGLVRRHVTNQAGRPEVRLRK